MKYTVIEAFVDLQDGNHVYRVGDEFPRLGHDVTLSRINELASADNRIGSPLITLGEVKKVDEKTEEKADELSFNEKVKALGLSKTEINRKPVAELQEIAKSLGVDEEMSGNQIKKMLCGALED